jgi:hypothetical protein
MLRKLISAVTLSVVIGALVAPSAPAAPVLTHPTGTAASTGTLLKATNIGETRFTSATLNLNCSFLTTTGTLKKNNTSEGFQGEATSVEAGGTGTNGDCTAVGSFFTGSARVTTAIPGGLPWCMKTTTNDALEMRGGSCSEAARSIKFAIDLTGLTTCTYERSILTGTFVTDTAGQDATGKLTEGQAWTLVSGFGCPSSPTIEVEYTEEIDTSTADPVYISS